MNINELKPDGRNYNKGTDKGRRLVKRSLKELGAGRSVLVDKDGNIIAGNKTVEAAKALGIDDVVIVKTTGRQLVAVQRTDIELDSEKGRALALADNATASAGLEWNYETLAHDWGNDMLEGWGIEMPQVQPKAVEDDFDAPEIEEIKTDIQRGDIIEIGPHRLMCGDSTVEADVERLMGGERADMVFTDPPYGMDYKGRTFGKHGLQNDKDNEWELVLSGAIKNISRFSKNALCAICFGTARLDRFFDCVKSLKFMRLLTIYKPNRMAFPWRGWILTSEVICLFENGSPKYNENNHCHDVYTFDYSERPDKSVNHPTVKPLSIVFDIIGKGGSGVVLDLFLGSGTTMVASHQLNRRCFGMEIDPKYCQVIVDRMRKLDPSIEIKKNGKPFLINTV